MRYLTARFLIIAALCGTGAAGAGDIYCNNQGHDCSDRPTPGSTMVRTTSSTPAAASEAPTPQSPTPGASNAPVDAGANARLSQDASRQAVQKDVAAARAAQCKDAKDKYEKSVAARRVYRMNKAGEREYLTDAETEQTRLNARLEMDQVCGKTTP